MPPDWICSQLGAREHYAIPRALHRVGRLGGLYTDFWAGSSIRKLKSAKLRALTTRYHSDLAGARIKSWNLHSLAWELSLRRRIRTGGLHDAYFGFIEVGQKFARTVRNELRRRTLSRSETLFFAYDTGALETFEWLRDRGIACILNQMDPSRAEVNLVREEEKRWPDWVIEPIDIPEEYFSRREREWALADRVVVNSEFCRLGLIQQGVPAEKLVVIPLCYEANETAQTLENRPRTSPAGPLKVLYLGQVILRKGIQYLMETAKLLLNEPVHFDVVGRIGISTEAVKSMPANMTFHGQISRDQIGAWYRQSDVFILPTLSDGFAVTQIEAMAHGLPVIATPNCGKVVSDGIDGFIVPSMQIEACVKAIYRYLAEPDLLATHRAAAITKSKQFRFDHLIEQLLPLEKVMLKH